MSVSERERERERETNEREIKNKIVLSFEQISDDDIDQGLSRPAGQEKIQETFSKWWKAGDATFFHFFYFFYFLKKLEQLGKI